MYKKTLAFASLALIASTAQIAPFPASASDADCAIWLCLPAGFPGSACGPARAAFRDRIRHLRPPLPDLASCMVSAPDGSGSERMGYNMGYASYIPPREECSEWSTSYGSYGASRTCVSWVEVPERYIPGAVCTAAFYGMVGSDGCTRNYRYITVNNDGSQIGDVFYFDTF